VPDTGLWTTVPDRAASLRREFGRFVRWTSGVRVRATLAATGVVAVVLALAGITFLGLLRHELHHSLAHVARQRTSGIAGQLSKPNVTVDRIPDPQGNDDSLVQILSSDGGVLTANASVAGRPAITTLRPGPGQVETQDVGPIRVDDVDKFVVVARGVRVSDGTVVVVAAQSLRGISRSTDVVTDLLIIGCPFIVVLVGLVAYWLTGRALQPVRAMSGRVAKIGGSDLDARIAVPPAGDDISQLAETMNAMLQRLQSASETQRRFVADASHELRSPLATIRAVHEDGNAHPEATDWSTMSADVLAETGRLDKLVADLLLLARIDEGGPTIAAEDVDLDDVVALEAGRLRKIGAVCVEMSLQPARVVGDRSQLERLVRNLTENAVRHAGSQVRLAVRTNGVSARIEVSDDGPGIPPYARERVFERFVRLDESRARDSGGSGLGLAIAREIVTAHGGHIAVRDAKPGACMVVTLPAKPDEDDRALR
jgi:signal transduction histidine kinase